MVVCGGGPPFRRASPGLTPCTARKARLNASVEVYPLRTAVHNRSRSSRASAAAMVIRRRRMYSDNGMPACDENVLRM